jgi:hypothetical protein
MHYEGYSYSTFLPLQLEDMEHHEDENEQLSMNGEFLIQWSGQSPLAFCSSTCITDT